MCLLLYLLNNWWKHQWWWSTRELRHKFCLSLTVKWVTLWDAENRQMFLLFASIICLGRNKPPLACRFPCFVFLLLQILTVRWFESLSSSHPLKMSHKRMKTHKKFGLKEIATLFCFVIRERVAPDQQWNQITWNSYKF